MLPKITKQKITKLKTKWKGTICLSNHSAVQFSINKTENWKQWGASKDELWITQPIVENLWYDFLKEHSIV